VNASGWLQSAVTTTHVLSMPTALLRSQFYFSASRVVSRAFSPYACAMHLFDVWASSSPSRYPCAKFRFCGTVHCGASPRRKMRTQSLTQSLTHSPSIFDLPGTEAYRFGKYFVYCCNLVSLRFVSLVPAGRFVGNTTRYDTINDINVRSKVDEWPA